MPKWRLRLFWAALLALVTAFGVRAYLGSLQETAAVLIASQDIPQRAQVTEAMITVVHVTRSDRQRLAADAFQSASDLVGRYARHPIAAGEILRDRPGDFAAAAEVRVTAGGREVALADAISPDARAVTVKVDSQAVLGQHLRRGDRVDVIFTSKSDSTGGVYASLILQQAIVLDIERRTDGSPDEGVLVALLVTPDQAIDLTLAKRTGVVDLVLNPPDVGEPVALPPVSPLKFAGRKDAPPAQDGIKPNR